MISCTLLKVTKEADLVETHILAALGIRFSRNILSSVQAETCISNSGKFVNIHLWRVKNADSYETQEIQSSLCSVNTAFSALRTLIPTEPADRKLSKIETLRLASSYISHLGAVLVAGPIDQPCLHADGNGDVYGMSRWADLQARPQVCTFCLAMHKKYVSSVTTRNFLIRR